MARARQRENQAQTYESLVRSARECIARNGYAATTVDQIAEHAGFSKGAFYYSFDSKEAIMLEILERIHGEDIRELRVIFDEQEDAASLDRAFDRWAEARYRNTEWAKLNVELQLHSSRHAGFAGKYAAHFEKYKTQLSALIALNFARHGKALPAPAIEFSAALIALVDGLALQHSLNLSPGSPDITAKMMLLVCQGWFALGAPLAGGG